MHTIVDGQPSIYRIYLTREKIDKMFIQNYGLGKNYHSLIFRKYIDK